MVWSKSNAQIDDEMSNLIRNVRQKKLAAGAARFVGPPEAKK
jgi:hypothetical protein